MVILTLTHALGEGKFRLCDNLKLYFMVYYTTHSRLAIFKCDLMLMSLNIISSDFKRAVYPIFRSHVKCTKPTNCTIPPTQPQAFPFQGISLPTSHPVF